MKFKPNGCYDLENSSFEELRNYMAGQLLEGFVNKGGEGLRAELREAMIVTIDWHTANEECKKK